MNTSNDSRSAFPNNYTTMADGNSDGNMNRNANDNNNGYYRQAANNANASSSSTSPITQGGHQQSSSSSNDNLLQSLLQQGYAAASTTGATNTQGQGTTSATGGFQAAAMPFWQSCRFCQQKYYTTSEKLLEHEVSCPMHLHVQQFLQNQQQYGQPQFGGQHHHHQAAAVAQNHLSAQNEVLQQQLQMQQNQLQAQFNQQNYGVDLTSNSTSSASSMFGQFNPFAQSNYGMQSQATAQAEQMLSQAQAQAAEQDQFERAIDRLPAFQKTYPEPKPLTSSSPDSATDYFPLALPEDEEWLTPLHCFVRKYCVEVFVATKEDVAAPCMGKRTPVSVNQVGIRCPHCSPERMGKNNSDDIDVARARENGVVYPSLIGRIYNSSINLLQRHLRNCAYVPPEVLARYEELKSSNARSGASKKYWSDSAARLGLVDTPNGIRLDKEVHDAYLAAQKNPIAKTPKSDIPTLVLPSDKRNTTAFTFHLMSQMQPCVFTEADRLGRRRGLGVGFPGLACQHCFGVYGSGRFFPSSIKTMADASKTLDVIYRHVAKCKNCPADIKMGLKNLREFHDIERSKMPFGNQRAFFVKIWSRLHESSGELGASSSSSPAAAPKPSVAAASSSQVASLPALPTNLPALPPLAAVADAKQGSNSSAGPSPESLQGLYATVKRTNEDEKKTVEQMNKLVNEAA